MAANNAENSNRTTGVPFKKGESGNPGGRPKVPEEVKEMLRAAAPQAVQLLVDTLNNDKVKTDLRIKCAETLLDRAYGKATQPIEGNMDNKVKIVMGGASKYAD